MYKASEEQLANRKQRATWEEVAAKAKVIKQQASILLVNARCALTATKQSMPTDGVDPINAYSIAAMANACDIMDDMRVEICALVGMDD